LVMAWKALNGTGFYWPPIVDGTMRLSSEQAMVLFSGMDWKRFQPLETTAPTASR
jgi:transposase